MKRKYLIEIECLDEDNLVGYNQDIKDLIDHDLNEEDNPLYNINVKELNDYDTI